MSTEVTIHDVEVGKQVTFSKTVAESDIYLFAGITGDMDPNHVDEEFCKTTSFGSRIAHGALIMGYMSTASTLILDDFAIPMVSAGYDRVRFIQPVFIGDTVTVTYTIRELQAERDRFHSQIEVTNQHGVLVAVATHIQQLVS